jgi:hypothetical protein
MGMLHNFQTTLLKIKFKESKINKIINIYKIQIPQFFFQVKVLYFFHFDDWRSQICTIYYFLL